MSKDPHTAKHEIAQTGSNDVFQSDDSFEFEIDLAEKARTIWNNRRTILIIIGFFLFVGYFHTEYGPTEYTSTTSLIQESEGASVGDFGSSFLRSLTGLNIPTSGNNNMSAVATGRAPLPVTLYPRIVSSTEFQKELIYTKFEFSNLDTTMTLVDYFEDFNEPPLRDKVYSMITDMTIYLPYTMYKWFRRLFGNVKKTLASGIGSDTDTPRKHIDRSADAINDDRLQSITDDESAVMNWLTPRISLTSDGGIMEITTTLPDPKAAALVNARLIEYIQEYITDYRVKKARQNLEATQERYELAKKRYEEAQSELAEFRDENLNLVTQSAQIEGARLNNEASLRFNIYNSVAQELEQARMVLQQQIPVFNPLEKPNVPTSPSTGSSPLIMVFSGILGLFVGVGWVLIRSFSFF